MTYIIENVNLLKGKTIHTTNMLVEKEKILSLSQSFKRYKHKRMDASQYIMTPTHVIFDSALPLEKSFEEQKSYFINHFILRGSTVFLTYVSVDFDHELARKLRQIKTILNNSPIDYVIGVKISARSISPDLLRKCKRQKVPAIFVEVHHVDELLNIPWGWIREAMFPYNSPLIPIFSSDTEKEKKELIANWNTILKSEKIPFIDKELIHQEALTLEVLAKIGIYPLKSNLHQGGELSYNFYLSTSDALHLDEQEVFLNHSDKLVITVHKGIVVRADHQVCFRPGFGENIEIKTPAFYKLS